jgi:enamine deaminase RidA (YjgF/YER057c/UK114 family)
MLIGAGQMYVQARQALLNLKHHIESAGFGMDGVVRTRTSRASRKSRRRTKR